MVRGMLFRRFAENLRRQDWAAIAIEFLIVVIGIYVAFELDRWRELEAERSANDNFVRLLRLELEEKLPVARERIAAHQEIENQQDAVIQWLNGDLPPSRFTDEMCLAAFRSLVLNWSATRLETADYMVTGEWTHGVQDSGLRQLLLELASLQEHATAVFGRFVLQIVNISDRYPELIIRRDTEPGQFRDGLTCDAAGMRASQAFKNQLFGNIGRQSALLNNRREELELLERILTRIGELR